MGFVSLPRLRLHAAAALPSNFRIHSSLTEHSNHDQLRSTISPTRVLPNNLMEDIFGISIVHDPGQQSDFE